MILVAAAAWAEDVKYSRAVSCDAPDKDGEGKCSGRLSVSGDDISMITIKGDSHDLSFTHKVDKASPALTHHGKPAVGDGRRQREENHQAHSLCVLCVLCGESFYQRIMQLTSDVVIFRKLKPPGDRSRPRFGCRSCEESQSRFPQMQRRKHRIARTRSASPSRCADSRR
jgi:hypothetical protein